MLIGSNQKGKQSRDLGVVSKFADVELPVYRWGLTFHIEFVRNVGNPYPSHKGNLPAREDERDAGVRGWRK